MIDRTRAISIGCSLALHGVLIAAGWMTLGRVIPPTIDIQGGLGADVGGGEFSLSPEPDASAPGAGSTDGFAAIDLPSIESHPDIPLNAEVLPAPQPIEVGEAYLFGGGPVEYAGDSTSDQETGGGIGLGSSIGDPSPQVITKLMRPVAAGLSTGEGGGSGGGIGGTIGQGDGDGIVRGAPVGNSRNRPPKYPEEARRRGLEGTVILRLKIAESGQVKDVSLVTSCGHFILDQSAIEAVRKWIFDPATMDGKPMAWEGEQSVKFLLRG